MASHYCINCPKCRRGCSICQRCACQVEESAPFLYKHPDTGELLRFYWSPWEDVPPVLLPPPTIWERLVDPGD